jgi:phosphoribosyl-ATP pyrophosphohydrolase
VQPARSTRLELYEQFVLDTWTPGTDTHTLDARGMFICCTGLPEEAGEVIGPVKKAARRHKGLPDQQALELVPREKLVEEGGDLLYYLTRLLKARGITLEEVMAYNEAKVRRRVAEGAYGGVPLWDDHGYLGNGHCSFARRVDHAPCLLPHGHDGEHEAVAS